MYDINSVLNGIGTISLVLNDREESFVGTLVENKDSKERFVFKGKCGIELAKEIEKLQCQFWNFWGEINGIDITLSQSMVSHIVFKMNRECATLRIVPSEIIIGRAYSDKAKITKISMGSTALNKLFRSGPLRETYGPDKGAYELKREPLPRICASDRYGQLSIYKTYSCQCSIDKIEHSFISKIEYNFDEATDLQTTISRIAAVRNLLSFFADYYIPLENFEFADEETEYIDEKEKIKVYDCRVYLNYNENIKQENKLFIVLADDLKVEFQNIWNKWLEFYNEKRYIPTLFYEIIRYRSTGINCFLNLMQTIEVYSVQYRAQTVEELREKLKIEGRNVGRGISLKLRIWDILNYLKEYLEIKDNEIERLSQKVSDMRNFFTHYNDKKYQEPSYQEVCAANRLFRYILLVIVYQIIGISSGYIKKVRFERDRYEYKDFKRDYTIIMREMPDDAYDSWF